MGDEGIINILVESVLVLVEFHSSIFSCCVVFSTGAQYMVTPANNKENNKTHHFLLRNLSCVHLDIRVHLYMDMIMMEIGT